MLAGFFKLALAALFGWSAMQLTRGGWGFVNHALRFDVHEDWSSAEVALVAVLFGLTSLCLSSAKQSWRPQREELSAPLVWLRWGIAGSVPAVLAVLLLPAMHAKSNLDFDRGECLSSVGSLGPCQHFAQRYPAEALRPDVNDHFFELARGTPAGLRGLRGGGAGRTARQRGARSDRCAAREAA